MLRPAGRPLLAAAFLLLALVCASAAGAAPANPPVPDAARVEILVKNTLAAFNQANVTGNYTVLRDLGSPTFRAQSNAARLGGLFTSFRDMGVDLAPLVVLTPVLRQPANPDGDGRLRLRGFFPTKPLQIEFDLLYEPVGGEWLMVDLSVLAVPAQQAASDLVAGTAPSAAAPRPRARPVR